MTTKLSECVHVDDYKNIELVKREEVIAREFYNALRDRSLHRMEWKWVSKYKKFYGFFAGYFLKKDFGRLHLRIKNYLNGTWEWVLAVEFSEENKKFEDLVMKAKLQVVLDELKKCGLRLDNYGVLKGNSAGRTFASFAQLEDVPNTFDEICEYLERLLSILENYAKAN